MTASVPVLIHRHAFVAARQATARASDDLRVPFLAACGRRGVEPHAVFRQLGVSTKNTCNRFTSGGVLPTQYQDRIRDFIQGTP